MLVVVALMIVGVIIHVVFVLGDASVSGAPPGHVANVREVRLAAYRVFLSRKSPVMTEQVMLRDVRVCFVDALEANVVNTAPRIPESCRHVRQRGVATAAPQGRCRGRAVITGCWREIQPPALLGNHGVASETFARTAAAAYCGLSW